MMVRKRHVFFIAGFDPYDVGGLYRRFTREAAVCAKTWNIGAKVSELRQSSDLAGDWTIDASGPNWATQTTYEPWVWHDIVRADVAGPMLPRLKAGAATFWDFIASGTAKRYFKANYRYGCFFLIPFLDVVLFAVLGIIAAWFAARAVPVAPVLAWIIGIVIALAAFVLLLRWPGQRWRVSQGLADWITAREYMYDQRPDIAARIASFSERLIARVQGSDADEILIVGHSLGATLAVDALAHALATDPELTRRGPKLAFLTIGATIPKLGLHPAATRLRACADRVAAEQDLTWGEFQTRQDPISFYRFDPVRLTKFKDNSGGKPHVRVVNFRDLLSPETTRRIFWDFMRIHYQFVMASERRGVYDLFTMVIGPAPLERTIWAPGGSAELVGEDGSYLEAAAATPQRAAGAAS
jgi:hypothetical protein